MAPIWKNTNIAVKELLPLVIGAALWGDAWEATEVSLFSDNEAVVASLAPRSARLPSLVHLLRCLFFFEAHYKFSHTAWHIPGKKNISADALSRNQMSRFFSNCPQARPEPCPVPPALLTMLMGPINPWTSPAWRRQFRICLQEVSRRQQ